MSYLDTDAYKKAYESGYGNAKDALSKNASFNGTFLKWGGGEVATGLIAASATNPLGWGILAGAALADLISWGARDTKLKSDTKKAIEAQQAYRASAYSDAIKDRNRVLQQAKRYVDYTKSNFSAAFGADSYDMLNGLFMSKIDNQSLATMFANSQYGDTDIENANIGTSFMAGIDDNKINDDLFTKGLSISDINSTYMQVLTDYLGSTDTAVGRQLQSISRQEAETARQYEANMSSVGSEYQNQFFNLFFNRRNEVAQGAGALGSAEAMAGSSGIRQVGSGSNNVLRQAYENALSSVAYSSTIQYMLNQYQATLNNANGSYTYQMQELRSESHGTKANAIVSMIQNINDANGTMANFGYEAEQYQDEAYGILGEYEGTKQYLADREAKLAQSNSYDSPFGNDEEAPEEEIETNGYRYEHYYKKPEEEIVDLNGQHVPGSTPTGGEVNNYNLFVNPQNNVNGFIENMTTHTPGSTPTSTELSSAEGVRALIASADTAGGTSDTNKSVVDDLKTEKLRLEKLLDK